MTVKRAEERLAEAREKRDALIRQGVHLHQVTVAEAATLAGLSRQATYEVVNVNRLDKGAKVVASPTERTPT